MTENTDLQTTPQTTIQPISESVAMIQMIERAAIDPNVDVDKMERLWAMKQSMDDRKAEMAYNKAMAATQAKMRRVNADAENPQTRSQYASYAALDKALRPIYTKHGLSLSFDTGEAPTELTVRVMCYVAHKGGHSRTYHADMPADGLGAKGGAVMTKTHAAGSAMSYGMRYLLKLIFNVAIGEDDDDGNDAGTAKVNAEQAANIRALIEETGSDEKKFLKWIKASKIEAINEAAYADCVAMLERKRKS